MKIEATEYVREDGVSMHLDDGLWFVRCVMGPTWFHHPTRGWLSITTDLSEETWLEMGMTFAQAYALLETVEGKPLK